MIIIIIMKKKGHGQGGLGLGLGLGFGRGSRTVFQGLVCRGSTRPDQNLWGVRASGHWAQQEVNSSTGQHAWWPVILACWRSGLLFF